MGQAVHGQHPAVVARSQFNLLRAVLAAALIAVIGLTVAVVILASDEGQLSDTSSAAPTGHINYGGFNPATGRPGLAAPATTVGPKRVPAARCLPARLRMWCPPRATTEVPRRAAGARIASTSPRRDANGPGL